MNVLAYLLGIQALAAAADATRRRRPPASESLPPIASTPERAAAWRRWAAGRPPAITRSARPSPAVAALARPRRDAPG